MSAGFYSRISIFPLNDWPLKSDYSSLVITPILIQGKTNPPEKVKTYSRFVTVYLKSMPTITSDIWLYTFCQLDVAN